MNKFLITILFMILAGVVSAQHKIVFDLNDADTATHSTVLRQFTNVLKAEPGTELELVCHGKAIYMFVKDKMYLEQKAKELKAAGKVSYKVCANSLRRYSIDQSQVSSIAEIVPVAVLEIAEKEKQGWSYIKAGN